jgi:hydrogenase nickel incorporation protein HypA/HybF
MHELGITQNIVAIVAEHAAGRRVARIAVDIGKLSGVMSDAVRFCFDVVAHGTCVEGAALEIKEIEGRGRCRLCHAEFATPALYTPCDCGSREIERLSGEELKVREFELRDDADHIAARA